MPITFSFGKFQVSMVTDIEVIRQIVFSHARVMVIGVGSDLKLRNSKLCSVSSLTVIEYSND